MKFWIMAIITRIMGRKSFMLREKIGIGIVNPRGIKK